MTTDFDRAVAAARSSSMSHIWHKRGPWRARQQDGHVVVQHDEDDFDRIIS